MRGFTVRMSSNQHQWSMSATCVSVDGLGGDSWRPTIDGSDTPVPLVSAGRSQVPQPHEVVRGDREGEHPGDALQPTMTELPQSADRLQPAKDLFYALALALTDLVARVARGPLVDGTAAMRVVLRHMRRDVQIAPVVDERGGVIILVAADGHAAVTRNLRRHRERGVALGRPRRG